METYFDFLAATYDFVEVENIGQSFEGRSMKVVKVSKITHSSYQNVIQYINRLAKEAVVTNLQCGLMEESMQENGSVLLLSLG